MGKSIKWSQAMLEKLRYEFPTKATDVLARELKLSRNTVTKKANFLKLVKTGLVKNYAGVKWTPEMIEKLKAEFPSRFTRDLAKEIGVSLRTAIRKARELKIDKEPGFLNNNRMKISELAQKARPDNPTKGQKGWCVPNSEKHRFKKGHKPPREWYDKILSKRKEVISKERIRMKYGLPRKTKILLK